jgi:nucleoid DNA-binding protein
MTSRELLEVQSEETVRRVFDGVTEVLVKSGRVEIDGFGAFELRRRGARRARNPRTGDRINVPEKTVVRFVPARSLKSRAVAITKLPHN